MGTDCMPIMHALVGRPRSSGVEDGSKLEGIAALLAADAAMTPTAAIRLPGRANRDHNSHSHGKHPDTLSNDALRCCHQRAPIAASTHATQPIPAACFALPTETIATEPVYRLPQPPLSAITREFVLSRVQAAIEQHAVPIRHWLQRPAIAPVSQARLAAGACAITATTMPRKPLTPLLH